MKWNKVSQKNLPYKEVLALNIKEKMFLLGRCSFQPDNGGFCCESDNEILTGITHWLDPINLLKFL